MPVEPAPNGANRRARAARSVRPEKVFDVARAILTAERWCLDGVRNEVTVRVRFIVMVAAVVIGGTGAARAQNAGAGAVVFKAQCGMCHSTAQGKNMIGPSLFGVVGRPAGKTPGFAFSSANRASRLTWDLPTLDRYLARPQDVIPKTIMPYAGLKDDEQRADLIAYLASLQ